MIYQEISGLDKKVSKIVFGAAGQSFIKGENQNELLDSLLDFGINTIDTARNYGLSEKSIGTWFRDRGKRDKVILLSKCGHPDTVSGKDRISEKEIRDDLEVSLKLLNTDYIDIYMLHRDDAKVPAFQIVDIMNKLYNEGRIKVFGVSNWTFERIIEANDYANSHSLLPISISSNNYCVAKKVINPWLGECVSLCGNKVEESFYEANKMPIFAYSSLGRGFFSGKVKSGDNKTSKLLDEFAYKSFYNDENLEVLKRCEELALQKGVTVSEIALAYLFNTPINVFPIVSSSSIERIKQNAKALDIVLNNEEMNYLKLKVD